MKSKKKRKDDGGSGIRDDRSTFPIVALGSSAGGLEALEDFFRSVPPESDMAYVVITHLNPHQPSLLVEIISKTTTVKTVQAENGIIVRKNTIYVIPPGKDMTITDEKLQLFSRPEGHEPFLPIDLFLRSLADDRKENAIAVILSGNGSDGSYGLKAIRTNLGLVMAQTPETSKYDSMPRSAIETGLVDYVLPPKEMPSKVIEWVRDRKTRVRPPQGEPAAISDKLHDILSVVKHETGHDFSLYKRSTINRRIERRMSVHQLESREQYVKFLSANPQEIRLLFLELIIDVTNFFRNPEAFEHLKEVLRRTLFAPGSKRDGLRVWVTACSTGEEAYSIGIILKELMDETGMNPKVQIFASDINEDSINSARQGNYPPAIADDVDAKRLDKFFIKHENGYTVKKSIREMMIFAPHDHIRDPPFLHLDLISCRNLMIYFEPALQRRLLGAFSNALNPNGILFLGESEIAYGHDDWFTVLDLKWKIYQRKPYVQSPLKEEIQVQPSRTTMVPREVRLVKEPGVNEKALKLLLTEHTPPSLIVDDKNMITYFHGRTKKYLEHIPGKASLDINNLLLDDLQYTVMSAIQESRSTGKAVINEAVQIRTNGDASFLNVIVRPLDGHKPISHVLVVFDEKRVPQRILKKKKELSIERNKESRIGELEKELNYTKENLRNTIEELETSNEELTSANEELQSNNEELQSVVEESETGKEELNSVNEELLTVNSELESKNRELTGINSDMRNLINSIDEAIIFLDIDLRIRRFTTQTDKIMNLLPGDVGRPIQDIAMNLNYEDTVDDVKEVLDTLNTKEKEVLTKDGRWYKLKILPYRTIDNVINGVVIIFSDIDIQKRVQEKLKDISLEAQVFQEYAESIVNTISEPLIVLEEDLIVRSANTAFFERFESRPGDLIGRPLKEIMDGMWNITPMIDRLKDLSRSGTENEESITGLDIPGLGGKKANIIVRKLQIPSGRSTRMLLRIVIDE